MSAASATAPLRVDLQIATDEPVIPEEAEWKTWVNAALSAGGGTSSGVVTVRLVGESESVALNSTYRGKAGPTNVLSFPGPGDDLAIAQADAAIEAQIGDLIICLPVACREAEEQGKRLIAHLAHLVVHGTLHLIGYDHEIEADAGRMESLEVRVLGGLGFVNPYTESE